MALTRLRCSPTTTASTSGGPAWSPDGEKIAFERGPDAEIWSIDSDGTDAQPLADTPFANAEPNWSPDGRQIVFSTDRDGVEDPPHLYTMDRDGSNQTRVSTEPAVNPIWSPDGTKFAFGSLVGPTDVLSMNVGGADVTNLTNHPAHDFEPDWQPRSLGRYPRPMGAKVISVSLVPSYRPCSPGDAVAVHGPPLAHQSCNAPVPHRRTSRWARRTSMGSRPARLAE
jgi:dipeptidyl aminopeptidase/acylaminoacyl peptidase